MGDNKTLLEKCIAEGLAYRAEDGTIQATAEGKELFDKLTATLQAIGKTLSEYSATTNIQELIDFLQDKELSEILALLITATDLERVGVAENLARAFEDLEADKKVEFLEVCLTPSQLLPLYEEKSRELVTKLREAGSLDRAPAQLTNRVKAELLQRLLQAQGKTPRPLQTDTGLKGES